MIDGSLCGANRSRILNILKILDICDGQHDIEQCFLCLSSMDAFESTRIFLALSRIRRMPRHMHLTALIAVQVHATNFLLETFTKQGACTWVFEILPKNIRDIRPIRVLIRD